MVERRKVLGLTSINLLLAVIGVLSTVQTSWIFGADRRTDIWFAASALQASMLGLVQSGQLSEIFLPEYIRLKSERGSEHARACYSVVLNWTILASVFVALLAFCLLRPIANYIGAGFAPDEREMLTTLFMCLLPLLPFQVIAGVQQMLGNAEGLFGRFEIPVAVGAALALVMVATTHPLLGIGSLVLSQWVMQVVAFLGRLVMLRRAGFRHRWSLRAEGFSVSPIIKQLGWTTLYVSVTHAYLISFRRSLGLLPSGVLSAFGYAELLYNRSASLFLRPVATVFFTHVSERANSSTAEVLASIRSALARYLEMYVLLAACLIPSLGFLIKGLWSSPRFGEDLLDLTTIALLWLFLAQILQAQSQVQRKLNIAMGLFRQQYQGFILVQLVCLVLAPYLVSLLGFRGAVISVVINTAGFMFAGLFITWRHNAKLITSFPPHRITVAALLVVPGILVGRQVARMLFDIVPQHESLGLAKLTSIFVAGGAAAASVVMLLFLRFIYRRYVAFA
jgi:peptidoglycan biosynthesis protein MviN/MurJ (putative lipid II flippase)